MSRKHPLPVYMADEEFSQILAVIHTLAPRRCLEWGSGGSTRALLESCAFVERYVCIEHDLLWHDRVRAIVTDRRLELHHVPPEVPQPPKSRLFNKRKAWENRAEVEPAMFVRYVAFPATLGTQFDFILVDGRARAYCLHAGWALLRPGGIIVLHDAQRPLYQDALFSLGRPVMLEPWHRGQVGFLRKPDAGDRAA
jgi:Methyltransferase domain